MFVAASGRSSRWDIPRLAAALAAIGAALAACGGSKAATAARSSELALGAWVRLDRALGPARLVRLGPGSPALQLRAHEIDGAVETAEALHVTAGARLEVLAMVEDPEQASARCNVSAIVDGVVKPLAELAPLRVGRIRPDERFAVLDRFERLSLDALTGREVRLRFELPSASKQKWLLSARLVPLVAPDQRPPDVLLICADALRYDCSIGSKGAELMPALTRLASRSTVFHAAYSSASWTLPSIASALTGLYPRFHGTGARLAMEAGATEVPAGYFARRLGGLDQAFRAYPQSVTSLGDGLAEVGYQTWMAVSNPLYAASGLLADGQQVVLDAGVVDGAKMLAGVRNLLEHRIGESPLCLLVHLMDAHQWKPWYYDHEHPDASAPPNAADVVPSYEASVRDLDRHLGEILELWNEHAGEDSLVVFFADHGEQLLEAGVLGHGNAMSEELLHVPLVARFPSRCGIEADCIETQVGIVDLMPTVLAIAGHPRASELCNGRPLCDPSELAGIRTIFADYQLMGDEESSVRRGTLELRLNPGGREARLFERGNPRLATEAGSRTVEDDLLRRELYEIFQLYEERGAAQRAVLRPGLPPTAEQDAALDALGYR